jgi:hypothetical protein
MCLTLDHESKFAKNDLELGRPPKWTRSSVKSGDPLERGMVQAPLSVRDEPGGPPSKRRSGVPGYFCRLPTHGAES